MKRVVILLIVGFVILSCGNRRQRTQLASLNDTQEKDDSISITICYPDWRIEFVFEDEREIYFVKDLFDKDTVTRMRGASIKRIEMDDSLLIRRVVSLVDGMGCDGKEEGMYIVEPDIALIIQNGKTNKDTVGLSATMTRYAVDSSRRGVLYPCPELMDIVVNYIAEHDLPWAQKQINFENHPNSDMEWLKKDSHSFCVDSHVSTLQNNRKVIIQYAKTDNEATRAIGRRLLHSYDRSSNIDGFLSFTRKEQILYDLPVNCTPLAERIISLLDMSGKLDPSDDRFKSTMMFTLLINNSDSIDTVGIGGWPLDRIQSSSRGDLYPNAELFRLVMNYVVKQDPAWLNTLHNSRVHPSWSSLQMAEVEWLN